MQEQVVAWNRGDINGFMNAYWNNDSLSFVGQKGITYGWSKTYENYKKAYPDKTAMGELSFEIIKIEQLSKNSCFVIGKWQLKRQKDSPGGFFTLLWKKLDKKWVIVVDHTS
jgi:ketosteroid isomerase-like protein